jgi:uncharacterized protein (TIGR02145 family)
MKSKFKYSIFILILTLNVTAQNIEVTFSARNNSSYVQLDSVIIKNLETGTPTLLYWPDTAITLNSSNSEYLFIGYATISTIGIQEPIDEGEKLSVFQNYPNPVSGSSTIPIYVPEDGPLTLRIFDVVGRLEQEVNLNLPKGFHAFRFTPGQSSTYIISAISNAGSQSIKVVVESSTESISNIEYVGNHTSLPLQSRKIESKSGEVRESGIVDSPGSNNQDYVFQFAYGIPCPGTETVSYEGHLYNTIQIFGQCWLKENLNVGDIIPNDQESENNGVIEKYCHEESEDSCAKYGGLYQWSEMMQYSQIQGSQGICPAGWHIPSDEEWKVLEGAVDSDYGIGTEIWDEIGTYRGSDAGFHLKSSEFYIQNGNGDDFYGFRGLPANAINPQGSAYPPGVQGIFWTSTLFYGNGAYHQLKYDEDGVYIGHYSLFVGFSVRCVKDL